MYLQGDDSVTSCKYVDLAWKWGRIGMNREDGKLDFVVSLSVGDKISHKKYGTGVIIERIGQGKDTEFTITFNSPVGNKRILPYYAPIFPLDREFVSSNSITQQIHDLAKKLFSVKPQYVEAEVNNKTSDMPVPFGYKCSWFAINTTDLERVMSLFNLIGVSECNWNSGISGAYKGLVFISPPVRGWTLIISSQFPDASNETLNNILHILAANFQSVQYFGTHRVVEYHAWAKIEDGNIVRKFAYLGETGEVIWNEGVVTEQEKELNFRFEAIEQGNIDQFWLPNEEDVLSIAGLWSVHPRMEYPDLEAGVGHAGKFNLKVF